MILIGVNIFPKLHARQLRLWVFFRAIWHWHLGILRMLHTKHWFGLNLSMQLLFGIPIMKLGLLRWRRCRGLQPGGPAGDGGTPVQCSPKFVRPCRTLGQTESDFLSDRASFCLTRKIDDFPNLCSGPSRWVAI